MGHMKDKWIEQMEPKPHEWERRWIPVEERVPEDGVRVLAHYDGRVFTAERFEGIWHWIEGNTFTPHVEHWMPMPEPPDVK